MRFVDGGAQRAVAARHRHDGRAEQAHAADVRRLALHVDLAHVHGARQADARARGGAATPCWPAPVSAIDALRAEALREQRLADGVVDLVRAGVREILALEPHLRAPALRKSRGRT